MREGDSWEAEIHAIPSFGPSPLKTREGAGESNDISRERD